MKHTPGPWKIDASVAFAIQAHDNETIARTYFVYGDKERENPQREANAVLIASAPDLLEELRNLRAWLEYWKSRTISQQSKDDRGHVTNCWAACPIPDWDVKQKLQAIEALIAKAEGA